METELPVLALVPIVIVVVVGMDLTVPGIIVSWCYDLASSTKVSPVQGVSGPRRVS